MKKYQSPLCIYVVWYPEINEKGIVSGIGLEIAEYIYSIFNKDTQNPISRGIGIPVFYRFIGNEDGIPISIDLSQSERNVVVPLIDEKVLLNKKWREYILNLYRQFENDSDDKKDYNRFIPISLCDDAHKISPEIRKINFINLYEFKSDEIKKEELGIRLTHEICRLLYQEPRISEIEKNASKIEMNSNELQIKLFLSYARKDGQTIINRLKAYIDKETSLKTFLDKIDIPPGYEFQEVLDKNIKKSTILIIQTDVYASREWCRWEVIQAKRNNRPIIVVNAINDKEVRSFPYLGNSPVIRYESITDEKFLKKIFHTVLFEILRYEYSKKLINNQLRLYSIKESVVKVLGNPPELLTLVGISKAKGVVLYPDPPITKEETTLLEELDDYIFLTPTMLPSFHSENK